MSWWRRDYPLRFFWGVVLILIVLVGLVGDQQTPVMTRVIGALFGIAIGAALIVSAVRIADHSAISSQLMGCRAYGEAPIALL